MSGNLDGFKVLDLSSVGPASRCSRVLADYGATVIKIGVTSKRSGAQIQPAFFSYGAGRGMKQVRIDLKAAEGRDAFMQLAATADVVIESYRPGVTARLGIDYESLRTKNPKLVYCSTSGYGQDGPYSAWAGHDINYLALGGFLHCSGRTKDGGPALPGATVADSAGGGMHAVIGILAALLGREKTGQGSYLDVSVAEGVLSLMALHIDERLATGASPGPRSSLLTGKYACYDVYPARDGKWLAVGAIEPAFFANLCRGLDLEKWIPQQNDDAVQDEIRRDFRAAFATRDRDTWVSELAAANTCVSPVNSIDELVQDPQFRARGAFVEAKHPDHGSFEQLGPVLAGGTDSAPHTVRDPSVTDSDEVFGDAGFDADRIRALRDQGVLE